MSDTQTNGYFNKENGLLFLIFSACVIAFFFMGRLEVFYDLEAFFPQNDPNLDFYEAHKERFEEEDNFIYLAVESENGVFDSVYLHQLEQFSKELSDVPHIKRLSSITNLREPVFTPFGLNLFPVLHLDQPEKYAADSTRIFQDERFLNRFVTKDGKTATILTWHEDNLLENEMRVMIDEIDAKIAAAPFEEVRVVGRARSITSIVNSIVSEFAFYIGFSIVFLLLVMAIFFRRLHGVAISMMAVNIGLILFMGMLGATGKTLDVMAPLFPTLMLVVGMSDVVHLLSKYIDEINSGKEKSEALRISVREIGWATLLTSVTTSIGFLSLYSSNLVAIKSFGVYAAAGVMIAYVSIMLFLMAVLPKIDPEKLMHVRHHNGFWDDLMERNFQFVKKNQKGILLFGILLFIASIWGISQVSMNVYLLGDVPQSDQLREDFAFFEEKLSGVRVFEVAVEAQGENRINDLAVLKQLEAFDQYIATVPEIGALNSPLTIYKSLHKANNSSLLEYYSLPDKQKTIKKYDRQIKKQRKAETNLVVTDDQLHARMSGNMIDLGSEKVGHLFTEIYAWIDQHIDPSLVRLQMTGTALMVDQNHVEMRESLIYGLCLAFLVVSILMTFLFRDIKMAFIALIPNVFPLLIAGAIMGFTGISLKASTSIIFTVAFGIAVDDTIHFLSKFRLNLSRGMSVEEAVRGTFIETGKALCLTTFILFAGFFILITSNFNATYYIGLLVSITLFTALIADLFLLPVIIFLVYGQDKKDL